MSEFLTFTILGLSLGAIYALAATGLVVTYTTSGIFNFAHGAVAMFAAFLYWQLRWDDGWGGRWPAPLALVFVLLVAAPLFGIAVDRLVMRGLRDTSEVVRIAVPIALLLFMIGAVNWIWGELVARTPQPFFGATSRITVGDVAVTTHQLIVFAVAVAVALGLWLVLYRTPLGVVMRAVVDDRELTQLNGARPELASAAAWVIGTFLAALAGVLISALQNRSLDTFSLTLLVVNAYAAAVFGRLRSLPLTIIGGLAIGLAVNYWNWASDTGQRWRWLSNLRISIPVLILFLLLLLLRQERLRGGAVARVRERFRVPSLGGSLLWGALFVAAVVLALPLLEPAPENLLGTGLALGIIGLSLVLLTGFAGEVNLAPLTFAGIGAMVLYQFEVGPSGVAARESASVGGYLLAAAIAGLTGALIAFPALRLRGLYLALATFAFAVLVSNLVFSQTRPLQLNIPWYGDGEDVEVNLFTPGSLSVPRPRWFAVDFAASQGNWLVLLAVVFAVLGVGLVWVRRSSYGRKLAAMKDSPVACATLGLSLLRLKLSVFAASAAIAGLGGALLAGQLRVVGEDNFTVFQSLPLVLLSVVAGIGYVSGGLAGGLLTGVAFVAVANVFGKLAVDYTALDFGFGWLESLVLFLGPALGALGLVRNPSGFLNELFDAYRSLGEPAARPILAGWAVVQLLLYVLAVSGAIGNWTFVLVSAAALVLLPAVAAARRPPPSDDAVPLELIGIDRPFTDADRERFDAEVGIGRG